MSSSKRPVSPTPESIKKGHQPNLNEGHQPGKAQAGHQPTMQSKPSAPPPPPKGGSSGKK